ncbi:MAG: ABC transporter substrate-binding protein [Desulfobacterales bacterium]|jgi:branched-chain amino acid transport system substrate-binding protein
MKTVVRATAMAVVFIAILISCPPHGFGAESYHLGVALGLSETGAPYSEEAVKAIEIAVNEINSQGGLLGHHPIELFIRDTRTDPKTAEQVVRKLIQKDKVRAVIGTYSSACAIAIKPICRRNQVLHMATISNSEDITKVDFSPYTFSVVPNTYMMAKGLVAGVVKLARERGWKRFATIASDYAWGRSSQAIQVELIKQAAPELQLVGAYWPPLGQTQFNTLIVAMMAQRPDFVLGTIGGADNAYFMRDAREYRFFKKIEYPGGLISVSELIRQSLSIRRSRFGRCRAPFFAHLESPMMRRLVEAYQAKHDRYPTDWAVMSYDGVYALKQGIEKAGSIEPAKVKTAMPGMTIETTRGRLFFRQIDNQLSCSAYFGRVADDPRYPFPIYHDLLELKGTEIWRTEAEIRAARAK